MPLAATHRPSPPLKPAAERPFAAGPAPSALTRTLVILVPALVAAGLAAFQIAARSLWLDEGASVAIASQHGAALWQAIRHDGGNMLAYYALLHVLVGAFGAGEAVIRFPSVIAHAATAALCADAALRLYGRPRVALGAGLLTAVSLPLIFWGQDARGYALMVTFATASFLAFVTIVQSERAVPAGAAVAYVASTLASLYLGYYAILIVLAEVAVLPLFRHRVRLVIGCLVVVALGCLPLLVIALQRGSGQLFWVSRPTLSIVGQTGLVLISAGLPPNFHIRPLTIAAAALTVVVALATLSRAGLRPRSEATWIALSWLLVPVVLIFAAAYAGEPVELARAAILVVPALSVLLASGLDHHRVPLPLGVAALVLLVAARIAVLVPSYGTSPENWKAAAARVVADSRGGACVLFYPRDGRMPFDYYVRGQPAATRLRPVYPQLPWRAVRPFVEQYDVPAATRLKGIARGCPRLWVIASYQGQRSGPLQSQRDLLRYKRLLADLRPRYRHERRFRFGYAAAVLVTEFRR